MVQKQKHMYQFEPEVKLLKRAVQVKEQVLEAIARRLKLSVLKKFSKFHRKTSVSESLFNKVANLKICNCIKKRLQLKHFEICKYSKNSFFTEQLKRLLLGSSLCFQRSPEQKPVPLSVIKTKFSWKKVFAAAKIQKQPTQVFCKRGPATLLERDSSIAKFLGATTLKNIFKRLLLKISIFLKNLPKEGNI